MGGIICEYCGKMFKYNSYLVRHQTGVQCKKPLVLVEKQQERQIVLSSVIKSYNCSLCEFTTQFRANLSRHKKICFKMLSLNGNTLQTSGEIKDIQNIQIEQIKELENLKDQIKILQSKINSVANETNISIEEPTNVNLTINFNNRNYMFINPVGCEDLSFITEEQLDYIYNDIDGSTVKLIKIIYTKKENLNFTKDNLNKPDIKYLSINKTIEYIHETDFITQFLEQRVFNYHLWLINKYKNIISFEKFKKYYRSINLISGLFIENIDLEYHRLKDIINTIKKIINENSRSKNIYKNINEYINLISKNKQIEFDINKYIKENSEMMSSIINEYKIKSNLDVYELEKQRNLRYYKKIIRKEILDQRIITSD